MNATNSPGGEARCSEETPAPEQVDLWSIRMSQPRIQSLLRGSGTASRRGRGGGFIHLPPSRWRRASSSMRRRRSWRRGAGRARGGEVCRLVSRVSPRGDRGPDLVRLASEQETSTCCVVGCARRASGGELRLGDLAYVWREAPVTSPSFVAGHACLGVGDRAGLVPFGGASTTGLRSRSEHGSRRLTVCGAAAARFGPRRPVQRGSGTRAGRLPSSG